MSDIFDDVSDILNQEESTTAEGAEKNSNDDNFNEDELQDIMAEIDNLEKDFATEQVVESNVAPTDFTEGNRLAELQDIIDRELQLSLDSLEQVESSEPIEKISKPLVFQKKSSSEVSFEAKGSMNLNLSFQIGQDTANLSIDPIKGLIITMSGVELCINQEDGCKVTMDTGVKFTIPLTNSEAIPKKKSA